MTEPTRTGRDPGLNPALKSQQDATHDTAHRTPPPVTTTSVGGAEGGTWPWIWLVVVIVCVLAVLYILLG
ncbi:hypothetical protein Rumeso_04752 [Rubellimicrobium mesophilum DSM 19309]|uniref:Uncharacterized protein n=1 Tax=Rubellimicrobium mesophilum DSM 19309 TaxID=442562 RepID=A0A017HET6_9RHOB|nr:hypothetical protein [Rubellimicrobium mesophilum]EYD72876.1 hypothetical protein Rumeso_04752 [Rubellimicrobium mesophilum DSM 19309]